MKTSKLDFMRENFTDDFALELERLLLLHMDELCMFEEAVLSPHWEMYRKLQEHGGLRVFTARADGELVGYAVYFIGPHHHYTNIMVATQDVLFLDPEYRVGRNGILLILFSENMMKQDGVDRVLQHTKKQKDLTRLLDRLGYEHCDSIMMKRI